MYWQIRSAIEPDIETVKEHVQSLKEDELAWLVACSVERCQYKFERIMEVFNLNDGIV